jgi:hypothetical protein
MKPKVLSDYLAWTIIISPILVIILAVLGGLTAVDNSIPTNLVVAVTVIMRVAIFLYPLAVLQYRIKSGSYLFLKKVVHYIALPLCLFLWTIPFIQNSL